VSDPRSSVRGLRIAAALIFAGAVLSGPVAVLVVEMLAPQPAWTSVDAFADNYRALQGVPYLLGYVLLAGFVLFAAACHALAPSNLRLRTSAALVFTAVYASLVFTNYTIQLAFIPRVLAQRPAFIAYLTMANPSAFAWFLEMFGYAAMGVATWLVAAAFGGSRRGLAIRYLLVANGVLSIVGAACTALFDRWVMTPSGFASFAAWNCLIPVCFALIARAPDGGLAGVGGLRLKVEG